MVKMAHPVEISRVLTAVAARSPKRENIKEEGCQTDKTPIAAIGDLAVTIWHEDGAVVVADKPATMAVHPADAGAANTLVNALLGCNRWLAEMETSYQPGVIYHLNPADRGLVVVAKNDEAADSLRQAYRENQWLFSFRVRLSAAQPLAESGQVKVWDRRVYPDGTAVVDIDTPIGDSDELRRTWLGTEEVNDTFFFLYRVDVPEDRGPVTVALGERRPLPAIELYTAPP
jgi:23S rRNA-/tRNA-specific pseudouridylate synthase